jgi:hypothetical protein
MNENEQLQLQKLIKMNNVEDQTQKIRKLKHSIQLREEINKLLLLKNEYKDDLEALTNVSIEKCSFLFTHYTDIYNRVKKDEIDIQMLMLFIDTLEQIENGEIDQHEGSFQIGKLLKNIYIDSALKKSEKLDKMYENREEIVEPLNISWKQWKQNI